MNVRAAARSACAATWQRCTSPWGEIRHATSISGAAPAERGLPRSTAAGPRHAHPLACTYTNRGAHLTVRQGCRAAPRRAEPGLREVRLDQFPQLTGHEPQRQLIGQSGILFQCQAAASKTHS